MAPLWASSASIESLLLKVIFALFDGSLLASEQALQRRICLFSRSAALCPTLSVSVYE